MSKITKTYANPNNGGQERITRDGNAYYISSNWGKGFCEPTRVSKEQAKIGMAYTKAPADVVAAILA